MARLPRIDVPDCPQHVRIRGNDRHDCFRDDADRWIFLDSLRRAALDSGCALHAYVLMTNHVHLVATGHCEGALSEMMRDAGSRFVVLFNKRHGRTGTLFEGRFRASVIDSDGYLLTVMRYVEANPVRARMVQRPWEYRWSSYAQNASGEPAGLLRPHPVYWQLGADAASRGAAYRSLWDAELTPAQLESIRRAAITNRALGSSHFCERLKRDCGREVTPLNRGRPRKGTGEKCP